jgi:hypothetical protein
MHFTSLAGLRAKNKNFTDRLLNLQPHYQLLQRRGSPQLRVFYWLSLTMII